MTVDYTFAPILLDASPLPSRFAAPLDSHRISWKRGMAIVCVSRRGRIIYVGPDIGIDLILRPRRRGRRPAGMPRSEWWGQRRGKRRQIGWVP